MSDTVEKVTPSSVHITLSDTAKRHFSKCDAQSGANGLRLSLKKTGCSGLSYVLDYVNEPLESDIVCTLDENFCLYIEKSSYPYIKGTAIDYIREGINQKLVYKNPNQTGECGCGESFTIEDSL